MDGIEATKRIRARERPDGSKLPPIVFVTAHAFVEYQQQADDVGSSGFLTKPFDVQKIRSVFDTLGIRLGV